MPRMHRIALAGLFAIALVVLLPDAANAQWRKIPYDADNFAADSPMAWTVDESDQRTFSYMINDRTMTVAVILDATTVSGVAGQQLYITIPGGHVGGTTMLQPAFIRRDSGTPFIEVGFAQTNAGSNKIAIWRPTFANHQLSLDQTFIYFTITFDIQ